MSHLLSPEKIVSQAIKDGKKPLWQELEVPPDLGPYLVTSSTSLFWLEEPLRGKFVRSAFRTVKPSQLYQEIIESIAQRALEAQWGSLQPYTEPGLEAAIEYLHYYELSEIEVLVNVVQVEVFAALSAKRKCTLVPATWVPLNCAVVVPTDRYYLGILGVVDAETSLASVHNAGRGIAFAWDRIL